MWSSFAFIGKMLDRTVVSFEEKERFNDLKEAYSKSLGAVGLAFMFLLFTLLGGMGVWFLATHPAPSRFFMKAEPNQATVAGQQSPGQNQSGNSVKEVLSSRSPLMSNQRVQAWTSRALMDMYTFNFTDADQVLEEMKIVFRPDTYDKFMGQLNKKGGILPSVKANSLIVSLTPTSEVRIIKQGNDGGYRVWMLEMHAAIYYSGALKTVPPPENVLFSLMVQEVPPSENPYGLVIAQISQNSGK